MTSQSMKNIIAGICGKPAVSPEIDIRAAQQHLLHNLLVLSVGVH